MVKRYPHIAKVKVQTPGQLINGEWVEGTAQIVEIAGRYDPVNTDNVIRENSAGDEVVVRGEFYTKHKKIAGAVSIEIAELGIKRNIICWWPYQSHSLISV